MKKSIFFLYGIIAYSFFIIATLYAIGFIGNFFVPKSIDSGAETTLLQSIIVNVFLLSLFAVQHSVMARPAFKKWLTAFVNPAIERSTYVLSSSLVLIFIYWKWQPMKTVIWKVGNENISFALTGVFLLGWLLAFLSSFMISHFEMFGLKQVFDNLKNKQTQNPTFKVNYLYKIIRHPMMLGFLIAFWVTPVMTSGHLMFAIITSIYIFIAVKYLEEKDLRKLIGKAYEDYQREVPMFFPLTKISK
ncbi:MAG: methanethiol S-methyltransferase [Bacteroidia bacterium]